MKESQISIKRIDNNLNCKIKIENKKIYNFIEIISLKDSAKLILNDKKKTKNIIENTNDINYKIEIEKSKKEIDIIKTFIEVIEVIQKILKLIEAIIYQGLNLNINLNIFINNNHEINFSFSDNKIIKDNSNRIYELYEYFLEIKNCQEKYEEEILIKKDISRLIFGANFSNIYKYLLEKDSSDVYFLNQYLEIKEIPNSLNQKFLEENYFTLSDQLNFTNLETNIKNIYESAVEYLNECKIDINNFLNKSILKEKKSGIYTYSYEDIYYENFVLNIFINETNNFSNNKSFLIWNKYTTKSQLLSFLYLSLFYNKNGLFLLIIKENIQKDVFFFFFEKLNEIKEKVETMESFLIILFSKIEGDYLKILRNIDHKIYEYKSNNNNKTKIEKAIKNLNILYYMSDVSGLGKSEMIKCEFSKLENKKMKYFYFPISGTINEEEIIDRLMEIKEENVYFHIDLIEINEISKDIIRDFLFCFIVFKTYIYKNKIFSYQTCNYQIIVELYSKNFKDFPILNFCNGIIINEPNYEKFKFDSKIAKIFKYLDEDNEEKKKIDLVNIEKLEILGQKEVINLFKKYFMNKNKTYYQIYNFSKIFRLNIDNFLNLINIPLLKRLKNDILISLISMSLKISECYYDKKIENKINENDYSYQKNNKYDEYLKIKSLLFFKNSLLIIQEKENKQCSCYNLEYQTKEQNDLISNNNTDGNLILKIIKKKEKDESLKKIDFKNINQDNILNQISSLMNSNKKFDLLIQINKLYSILEGIKIKDVLHQISEQLERILYSLTGLENLEVKKENKNTIEKKEIENKFNQLKIFMENNVFNRTFKEKLLENIEDFLQKKKSEEIQNSIINYNFTDNNNNSDHKIMIQNLFTDIEKILFGDSGIVKSIMNYEYKEDLIDFLNLYETLKYYIFTYDNYLKFTYIFMKLKVDLPVILMGETGVGKTALIKVLINSLPYKAKLIIKNIHNGIDNKNIE